ncbi:MAG: Mur ligase family protein [Candidatus Shapirobacteria bacterium]
MKKVHIIGVAGQLTGPLAGAFKAMGWKVTGSDQKKIYPPLTTYLEKNNISYTRGFNLSNISKSLDLVVTGGSVFSSMGNGGKPNIELDKARKLGLKIISQAGALQKILIKQNSIVVAGTYGKTTTTAMVSAILKKAGFNPSHMFGGIAKNSQDPLRITDSNWSIVEGDEYLASDFNYKPKFLYYRPKYLLLTAARWEHQDVYKKEKDYLDAFKKLISLVPFRGFILANKSGENLSEVLKNFTGKIIFYNLKKRKGVDWWTENISLDKTGSRFVLKNKQGLQVALALNLLGKHNIENALSAASLGMALGADKKHVQKALKSFRGIKRRLEILGTFSGVTVVDDFSQSRPRAQAALLALKDHFPNSRLVVIYDPHYSGLLYRSSLDDYPGMFDLANRVLVSRVSFRRAVSKKERVLGRDIIEKIRLTQKNARYLPLEEEIVDQAIESVRSGDVLAIMSSGGQRAERIKRGIIAKLKKRKI